MSQSSCPQAQKGVPIPVSKARPNSYYNVTVVRSVAELWRTLHSVRLIWP